jgi:hypothetical protein
VKVSRILSMTQIFVIGGWCGVVFLEVGWTFNFNLFGRAVEGA